MSEPAEITEALKRIAHASTPARQLARERVVEYRARATPRLTQEQMTPVTTWRSEGSASSPRL